MRVPVKIYTKTGDDGTTGLFGGARVAKHDPRVEAYGTVDEANATIGVARAAGMSDEIDGVLERVQTDLFIVGAELASVPGSESRLKLELVGDADVLRLEAAIDAAERGLPPLETFVLPGGSKAAAVLHQARTVTRRAERQVLALREVSPVREALVVYLNRLSDLLFVLARRANQDAGIADVPWAPRQKT